MGVPERRAGMGWRDKGTGWRGGGEVGVVLRGCARARVEGEGNQQDGGVGEEGRGRGSRD